MKKTTYLFLILLVCLSNIQIHAQNNLLNFDGVGDYLDLGQSAGNGVRTIEMWFELNTSIDSTLTESATLISRSSSGCGNCHLFYLAFTPTSWTGPTGTIMFQIRDASGSVMSAVFSDQNNWSVGEWHHVAAVSDQTGGTMLFIDGIKQLDVDAGGVSPTTSDTRITAIGKWGESNSRYFDGKIDDIRISSIARYTSDFTPPCPGDFLTDASTLGLWNLDEGTGSIAVDNSGNGFDGVISDANWSSDTICTTISTEEYNTAKNPTFSVNPNPVKDRAIINIESPKNTSEIVTIEIRDVLGTVVGDVSATNSIQTFEIDMSDKPSGVYFYTLIEGGQRMGTQKFIHLKVN